MCLPIINLNYLEKQDSALNNQQCRKTKPNNNELNWNNLTVGILMMLN